MTPSTPKGTVLNEAAAALAQARSSGTTIGPITVSHGIAGLEQAYAVAAINTAARLAQGERIVGSKIGLTSLAVQQQLGVDQPDFGVLFDNMEYVDGDSIPAARLLQAKAEVEVAFVVGQTMSGPPPAGASFCTRSPTRCRPSKSSTALSRTGKSNWKTRWPTMPRAASMCWATSPWHWARLP